jgi:type IV secretory pathway protease TraF
MQPGLADGQGVLAFTDRKSIEGIKEDDLVIAMDDMNREVIKRVSFTGQGKLFLSGDNAVESRDSRHYGLIERNRVIGKAWKKY